MNTQSYMPAKFQLNNAQKWFLFGLLLAFIAHYGGLANLVM